MKEVARVDFSDAKLELDSIPLVQSLTLKRGPNFLALTAANNSAHDRLPAAEQIGFSYFAITLIKDDEPTLCEAFVISIPTAYGRRHISWTEGIKGPQNITVARYRLDTHGQEVLTPLDQKENPQEAMKLAEVYIDGVNTAASLRLQGGDESTFEMLNLMNYVAKGMTRVTQTAATSPFQEEKEPELD